MLPNHLLDHLLNLLWRRSSWYRWARRHGHSRRILGDWKGKRKTIMDFSLFTCPYIRVYNRSIYTKTFFCNISNNTLQHQKRWKALSQSHHKFAVPESAGKVSAVGEAWWILEGSDTVQNQGWFNCSLVYQLKGWWWWWLTTCNELCFWKCLFPMKASLQLFQNR